MYNNILVVRTDRIGDVVLTIPAVRALKEAFPEARITMWTTSSTQGIVHGLPYVDEVITHDPKEGLFGYLATILRLRMQKYDLAVIYHTKRFTNAACFLARIPDRLGYRNNKFGALLNMPVEDDRHLGRKHELEYCLDLLRPLGVMGTDQRLEVPLHDEGEVWVNDLLRKHALLDRPIVLLHPDASCPTKRWPIGCFARLADDLRRHCKAMVIVVGGQAARPLADTLVALFGEDILDLVGKTTIVQLVSLLRRSRVLISNDSGPVHLAAAVRTPVISLFLRSQPGIGPERWRPLGPDSIILKNKLGEEITLDKAGNVISGKYDSISVDEVFMTALPYVTAAKRNERN